AVHNANRIAALAEYVDSFFPGSTNTPHAVRLAGLRVVRDDFCVSGCRAGHPAAYDIQRKVVLVPGDALRRHSVRAVREPQSLRGIGGIGFADSLGAFAVGPSTPRKAVHRGYACDYSAERIDAVCFARRNHQPGS